MKLPITRDHIKVSIKKKVERFLACVFREDERRQGILLNKTNSV